MSIYRFKEDNSNKFTHLLDEIKNNVEQHVNDLHDNYDRKTDEINIVQEYVRFNDLINYKKPFLLPNEPRKFKMKLKKGCEASGYFSISNLNIVAQKGCFIFYYNNSHPLQPFETDIECVDIHKSLIPYLQDTIIKNHPSKLFPQESEIVKVSLQKALSHVVL